MPDDPKDNANEGADTATHDDGDEQSAGNLHPVSLSSPGQGQAEDQQEHSLQQEEGKR